MKLYHPPHLICIHFIIPTRLLFVERAPRVIYCLQLASLVSELMNCYMSLRTSGDLSLGCYISHTIYPFQITLVEPKYDTIMTYATELDADNEDSNLILFYMPNIQPWWFWYLATNIHHIMFVSTRGNLELVVSYWSLKVIEKVVLTNLYCFIM